MKRIRCVNCSNGIDADETMKSLVCPSCGKKYKNPFYVEPLIDIELEELEDEDDSTNTNISENITMPKVNIEDNSLDIVSVEEPSTNETESKDKFESVICDSCGSNDIKFISTEYGICNHCGTKIILKKEENPTSIIHVHSSDSNISYYGVKKELTPDVFLRGLLIDICRNSNTPPDIFDSEFPTATESNKHYMYLSADVTGSYSCELGYHKIREWEEWDSNQQKYVTKKEYYTEWKPYAGSYASSEKTADYLDDKNTYVDGMITAYYDWRRYGDSASITGTDDIIEPSQETINSCLNECVSSAKSSCQRTLPGDEVKNYVFNGFAKASGIECHTIPAYTMKCKYKGIQYTVGALASSKIYTFSYGKYPNVSKQITNDAYDKAKPLGITSMTFSIVSIILSILLAVFSSSITLGLGLGLVIPFGVLAIILYVCYKLKVKKIRKDIVSANFDEKIKGIKNVLSSKGLSPLTNNEIEDMKHYHNS